MGGTAGLFVGASLLSFVELIYFFTLRVYDTLKMKKKNKVMKEPKIQQAITINKKNLLSLSIPDKKAINSLNLLTPQRFPETFLNDNSYQRYGYEHHSPWAFHM